MRKSWLVCVLLGTVAWGQAAAGAPPQAQPAQAPAAGAAKPQVPVAPADASAAVPPEAAVITVEGVCAAQPKEPAAKGTAAHPAAAGKTATTTTPPADCKTVVTKAEFELLLKGIPNVAPAQLPQLKKNVAAALPKLIAMSAQAQKKSLDKTPEFNEQLKIHKMQILASELQRSIQEEAAKVPQEEIEKYYKANPEAYETYNLERLFVPRGKQEEAEAKDKDEDEKNEKLSEEQQKAKQAEEKAKADEGEQAMTKLAETLRARAEAGEDFAKLQKEAFDAAGMKIASPNVTLTKVRRTGLPPAHSAAFDLKAGEVSQVINDAGGHYIYKVTGKEELTLDQVKDEIQNKLKNDRSREMMDAVQKSFTVDTNEAYFGPGGPGGNMSPPSRMPNPRMAPNPTAPAAQPQTPPPAQPPAPKPN